MQAKPSSALIPVEREGFRKLLSPEDLKKLTGASLISQLIFSSPSVRQGIARKHAKYQKKGLISREQKWWGIYFKQELSRPFFPDVYLRWIDPVMGWGVFANRPFKKMEFITTYIGKVRRRKRADWKNSYCFEYLIVPYKKTPYTIDAREEGGISRFINHSSTPNLTAALATYNSINHVILFTRKPIPEGAELTYDYGPDYWSHRPPPR